MISSMLIYGGIALLLILLWLVYRYSLFIPAPTGLPILLYHKVSLDQNDALTISVDRLDRQLAFVKSSGYSPISFSELKDSLDGSRTLPTQPVIVTFDDGYISTYELAYPLLVKHDVKATIFLPTAFIGGKAGWSGGSESLMSYEMIRHLAANPPAEIKFARNLIEFGLHGHRHESYERYTPAQIESDLSQCVHALEASSCAFSRVFAYPYGRMPRDPSAERAMREFFRHNKIDFAARIGSRINAIPPADVYELKRTAVRGTDSFWEFKTKLRKGRIKLF
jgi:peptidoglycan/xylan/chitin deacetylase (PgdA/CDA1 family)